ncbi:BUD13 like [Actinidia chinensis var. chinensis]|uniref:BUD13 like n=1 Tax=Actinidia chinensis var. chinensis TaxID=1590841 RepID=A0A2R6QJT9_ACTCC|nr:BUD13 like [Actinidia chinensis var. chinensis]
MVAATSSASGSLKEYLKRYESKNEEEKKKKKKKKRAKPDALGVLVVDEDPVWQKPVQLDEDENDDSADEEKPLVDEDIEVKRMKRLEQLRLRRPFGAISEDGSGWVPVSDTLTPLNSNEQNSDLSPPRKRRIRNDTSSPEPDLKSSRGGREVTDLSPPRHVRRRHPTPSPETETKSSHSLGLGPKHGNSNNQSSDISPPRKQRARYETLSPEPNLRSLKSEREVTDLSPVRRRQHLYSTSSPETEMNDPDFSPRQESSDYGGKNSEISESRDISPPRRGRRSSLHQDVSHVSQRADLSPPRKVSGLSSPKNVRKESSSLKEQPKTGLITGQDIKEENARTKKTDWARFKYMDPSVSGQGAEPVYRDKATGARISKDELMKLTKKDEKPKEIKLEWGKGLAQKREAETKQLELELEKDKPFARTRDDPELDRMLKDRLRWGDPMAHLRKNSEHVLPDLGENEKMKESGFIIPQDIPSHSWLKRGLDAAPNRYGIKPGRHWDGVDRSNGFEKQMFKRTNEKQATEREAYLWSVSDM